MFGCKSWEDFYEYNWSGVSPLFMNCCNCFIDVKFCFLRLFFPKKLFALTNNTILTDFYLNQKDTLCFDVRFSSHYQYQFRYFHSNIQYALCFACTSLNISFNWILKVAYSVSYLYHKMYGIYIYCKWQWLEILGNMFGSILDLMTR
jgi:uncharacterized membrane protein